MRPIDVKKLKYKDKLASKRRRSFHIKAVLIGVAVVVVIVGIGYVLFYASWLKVTNITFEGLTGGHQNDVQKVVDGALGRKILGIPIGRDIFFVRSGPLETDLISQFSFIESVSVQKKYFHTLKISATERQAEGVWCFVPRPLGEARSEGVATQSSPDCRYFDHGGVTFGQAIQSSGVLLLNVNDLRVASASTSLTTVDPRFLEAIQTVVPVLTGQDVKIKNITIPVGTYTEFDILTGDAYLIKFSLDSDIKNQLDIFRIFRTQKMANGVFHPQYVDLRFDGRIYYK